MTMFLISQGFCWLADTAGMALVTWFVAKTFDSSSALSLLMGTAMFTRSLSFLFSGALGDYLSRHTLITIALCANAALLFFTAHAVVQSSTTIMLVVILTALAAAFKGATDVLTQSFIVDLAKAPSDLPPLVQGQLLAASIGGVLGGGCAGLVIQHLTFNFGFVLIGCAYAASGLCFFFSKRKVTPAHASRPMLTLNYFTQSLSIIRQVPLLYGLVLFSFLTNTMVAPIAVLLPLYIKREHLPPWLVGGTESSLKIGLIAGGLVVSIIMRRLRPDRALVLLMALAGLVLSLLMFSPSIVILLTSMFTLGFVSAFSNMVINSNRLLATPPELLSRVNGLMIFICMFGAPLGCSLGNYLAETVGLRLSFALTGGGLLALAPALYLIPGIKVFLQLNPDEAKGYFLRKYPAAFLR